MFWKGCMRKLSIKREKLELDLFGQVYLIDEPNLAQQEMLEKAGKNAEHKDVTITELLRKIIVELGIPEQEAMKIPPRETKALINFLFGLEDSGPIKKS
jgi:hypothetical protein